MSEICYDLDAEKFVETLVLLASRRLPELTPLKTLKLIYLADKAHLQEHGRPIVGGRYLAEKNGPCPQEAQTATEVLCGKRTTIPSRLQGVPTQLNSAIRVDYERGKNPEFVARREPDLRAFSRSDLRVLESVIREHGQKTGRQLVDLVHTDPIWIDPWQKKSLLRRSAAIPYEVFLSGSPDAMETAVFEQNDENFVQGNAAPPAAASR